MILVLLMGQFRRNVSSAVFRNQMEDRALKNKLGSIEFEQKRLLKRFRSETRLLKIRQEQRLGSFTRRSEVNGAHMNTAGNPSPRSAGATCPLDFMYGKRQIPKSIYSCGERPVNASDGDAFLTDGEWMQPSRRPPSLPSVVGRKTPKSLSLSKDSCQSPVTVKRKAIWNSSIIAQDSLTSAGKAFLRDAHETKGTLGDKHGSGDNSKSFIKVTEPYKKSNGPRVRRQTWNGQVVPKLLESKPVTVRNRSYSDKDQPQIHRQSSLTDSTEATSDDISCFHTDDSVFVTNLNTSWNKKTFPTAEDALQGNFLSVPRHPVRKSNSLNSLKSLPSLPPVPESEDCQASTMRYRADDVNEKAADGIHPLSFGGKETVNPGPVFMSSHDRHQRLSRQENVTRDPSISNVSKVPIESMESPRDGEKRSGFVRKIFVKYKTGQNVDKQGERTNKEISVLATKREKLSTTSKSLSSSLGQCFKEEIRMEIPRRKESIKPRRRVLDKGLETKEQEEVVVPMEKPTWMKAMRKVVKMNIFLSGIVALRKQRELDRLALKTKQDALDKLYQELEHCRYLRLPSNGESEKIDFISWVFEKD